MERLSNHADIKQQALALIQNQQFEQARVLYARFCAQNTEDAEAWFMLGAINGRLGDFEETIACCLRATAILPDYADAYYNLAQAYMHQCQYAEAADAYRQVVRLHPRHAVALNNLGYALQQTGRYEEAADCHRRALQIQPGNAEALHNLGNALLELKQPKQAEACFRQALQIDPGYAEASNSLGMALRRLGNFQEAASAFQEALRLKPEYIPARIHLGVLLSDQSLHKEAEQVLRDALQIQLDANKARSGLLFCLNYHCDEPDLIFREHREWNVHHARPLDVCTTHTNLPDPERRLRIGYVSPDLRTHSVAYFFEPLLKHHDPASVETVCYADVPNPDATTARLQAMAGSWRNIARQSPGLIAEQILRDEIDILVDLSGHTGQDLMLVFARKPAPIQVTYLGYPNTTGLSAVDYRFTDAWADPPGQTERWHTETLVRLPHGFLCYEPRVEDSISTDRLAQESDAITFGSFNNLPKITPEVVALWARILHAVPGSRLLIKSRMLKNASVRERYYDLFSRHGIPRERVDLLGWIASSGSHLALYGRVDIALDPFPYNGTTTTCEALWMGVPVITLAGRLHAGRVGVSLLSQIGLTDLIADNPEHYLALAVQLAGDRERRDRLRMELRHRMKNSPLCDGPSFARDIENAYREMWRKWCAGRLEKG